MTVNVGAHSYVVGGLGVTGQACVRFLQSKGANVKAFDTRASVSLPASLNIDVATGPLTPAYFDNIDTLILSPGLPLDIEQVKVAKSCGVEVIGDVELFARLNHTPVIGITGSNGKTTVTLLTLHMLKACGFAAMEAGNVGRPVLDTLNESLDVIVLELSSFQLETTSNLALTAATILNISDDHLDRHGNMENYAAAKQRIFTHCQTAIVWRGSSHVAPLSPCSASLEYGIEPSSSGFGLQNDTITYAGKPLLTLASIPLAGLHNVLNVMASLALCHAFGASLEKAARAVVSFEPPPHRCIEIANVNGVRWIDDSKATNVGATIAAIEGLSALTKGRIILIAGGDGKGANLSNLKPLLDNQVAKVIALGKDAAQFSAMFGETFRVTSMEQAVKCAAEIATTGDVVLLSPACASIDMFRNYAHRGEVFAHAVTEFIAPSGVSPGYVGAEATHL